MKSTFGNEKGSSILGVMVLAVVVGVSGYLSINTFKGNMDSAKKDSLNQQSSQYTNILESKVVNNCEVLFPTSIWKTNLTINQTATVSNVAPAENAIKLSLELKPNESIELSSSRVLSDAGDKGKLVEVNLTLNRANASSSSQKLRLFVKNRICSNGLSNGESLSTFCDSTGAAGGLDGCNYNAMETRQVSSGNYERQAHPRSMDETLCKLKVEAGNAMNYQNPINGEPDCKIKVDGVEKDMLYGCYLDSGKHIENTKHKNGVVTSTSKNKVSDDVNKLRKEAIQSQSIRIASKFERLRTYVETNSVSISDASFLYQVMDIWGLTSNSSVLLTGGFGVGLGAAILGGGGGVGAAALLSLSLGPAAIIGAPIAIIVALLLNCGKSRQIVTNYQCNQGSLDIKKMMIQKKKAIVGIFGVKCRWRDEKEIDGVNFYNVADTVLGEMDYENPVGETIDDEDLNAAAALAQVIAAIQGAEVISDLYQVFDPDSSDPNDVDVVIPQIETAFLLKEAELWAPELVRIQAIIASDDNAMAQLNAIEAEIGPFLGDIRDINLKNSLEQLINDKRNEIES